MFSKEIVFASHHRTSSQTISDGNVCQFVVQTPLLSLPPKSDIYVHWMSQSLFHLNLFHVDQHNLFNDLWSWFPWPPPHRVKSISCLFSAARCSEVLNLFIFSILFFHMLFIIWMSSMTIIVHFFYRLSVHHQSNQKRGSETTLMQSHPHL